MRRISWTVSSFVLSSAGAAAAQQWGALHQMAPEPTGSADTVAAADFDGDGDPDLVLSRPWPYLFFNDGLGRFTEKPGYELPHGIVAHDAELGDVDGDGDLDLAVCSGSSNALFLNDGFGRFSASPFPFPATERAHDIDLVDVDNDLDLDVWVSANDWGAGAYHYDQLLLNDGFATFTDASQLLPRVPVLIHETKFADLDGDGDVDALATDVRRTRLYLNVGSGAFVDASATLPVDHPSGGLALGDIDLDGDVDAVISDDERTRVLLNDGAALFVDATAQYSPNMRPSGLMHLVDLDGDGFLDLFRGGQLYCALHRNGAGAAFVDVTAGSLPTRWATVRQVAFADFDSDGDVDGFGMGMHPNSGLLLNDGAGRLVRAPTPLSHADAGAMVAASPCDVDADGDTDLFYGTTGGEGDRVRLLLNDGASTFGRAFDFPVSDSSSRVFDLADVDADGDVDVFVGGLDGASGSYGQLLLNSGGAFASSPQTLPANPSSLQCARFGDLDGDGDEDLMISRSTGVMRHWRNDGAGAFSPATTQLPPQVASLFGLADLDGDGDLDAYVTRDATHRVWLNDGVGNFSDSTGVTYSQGKVKALVFIDLEGDGDIDIATANYPATTASLRLSLWRNDGSAVFTSASQNVHAFLPFEDRLFAGDVDEDGDVDLWTRSARLLRNDGLGVFSDAGVALANHADTSFLGDLDHDGDLDVIGSYGGLQIGLARHVAWRGLPRIGKRLELDVHGPANERWVLVGARERSHVPFTPFGVLGIDRDSVFRIDRGVLDGSGRAMVPIDVPNDPSLLGQTIYWQALVGDTPRLSNLELTQFTNL